MIPIDGPSSGARSFEQEEFIFPADSDSEGPIFNSIATGALGKR